MSRVAVALRILWESFAYRLRAREANNLGVTISMMVAFRMPWADVAYRSVFALLLNVYVYLINDYCDLELDLASTKREADQVRYVAEHRGVARAALLGLGALLLVAGALHSWLLVVAFAANSLIVYTYSAYLKRVPGLDVLMMALAGATMTMVGVPGTALGWKLLGLLALLCASYEVIQLVRDEPEDREQGVRSTAVRLGARRAAAINRAIAVLAAAYGYWGIGTLVGLGFLPAAALPLTPERASRSWDLSRVLYGGIWLMLLVQIYLGQLR